MWQVAESPEKSVGSPPEPYGFSRGVDSVAELPRVTAELQRHLSAPIARGEKGTRVWKDSLHDGHYSLVYDPGDYVFGCVAYRNLPRGPRVPCI